MTNFDIIGVFKTYCDANGIAFLSGSKWYQNYEASRKRYDSGTLVLGVDFNASPVYSKANKLFQIQYTGAIMLGRKFETTGTISSIDETFYQKHVNRLLELMQGLDVIVRTVACANELIIGNVSTTLDLNAFDTSIDFVAWQLTLTQG
jgi:hypothetical protein